MAGKQLNMGMQLAGYHDTVNTIMRVKEGITGNTRYIVGVGAEYGAYVEFGTSTNRAQPYLLPAAREVMRSDFPRLEKQAKKSKNPLSKMVELVALEIEAKAKDRAPVDTGTLQNSIEAAPAGGFQ